MRHLYTFIFLLITSSIAIAQCTNSSSFGTISAPTSGTATISTCSYQTEYSTINNVQAASIYECAILNGGYITIRQGTPNGTVVTSGVSPLTWTSTSAGTYFAHWNTDANCGTATNCDTTTITYVSAAFPCSGTPAPGNTLSSAGNTVCPNAPINLTLQNPMLGSGITYQWYLSTDGVNYSQISGANAATYSTSISVATYFYCAETCSGSTTNSDPINLTILPFIECYCTPLYFSGTESGDLISNVEIAGTTLSNNTGFVAGGPSYTYYTGQPNYTATLVPSNSYNLNISTGEWGEQGYAAWIDYNDDGIFDLSERIGFTIGTIGSNFTLGQINASSSFVISLSCTPPAGSHRLRIRGAYFVDGEQIDPCLEYGYGETEDYQITIAPPPTCPSAGLMTGYTATQTTATVSWLLNCSSSSLFNIEYGPQGFSPGTGTLLTNQTVTVVNDTASLSLNGLTATTNYDFYYQAVCGGTTSAWSATNSFTTACGSITALEWCEGFDSDSQTEQCWTILNANNDFSAWNMNTEFEQFNGNNCASINTDNNLGDNDDWLISPQLSLTGTEILSFYYKVLSAIEPHNLMVKISTTGNTAADFTTNLLSLDSIANENYLDTSVNLSGYTGNVYIAFHIPQGGLDGWVLYLDQICVQECVAASIQNDSIEICQTADSIDLTTVLNIGQSSGSWSFIQEPTNLNGSILQLNGLTTGIYEANYLVNNACQSASATAFIHLYEASNAGIDGLDTLCKGQPYNLFDALSGNPQTTGIWYNTSNQPLTNSTLITSNFPGLYNYDYIMTNGVCQSDTSNVLLIVNDCIWVGIDEMVNNSVTVYPNPANDMLNVEWNGNVESILVMDAGGRILSKLNMIPDSQYFSLPVNNIEKGVYWIVLETGNSRVIKSWIKN